MTQQIPNLGLSQQQSVSNAKPPALLANDDVGEKPKEAPPELLSRPKIPRTPAEGEGRGRGGDQDMPQQQQLQEENVVKIKDKVVEDEKELHEHADAFGVREKINRTPDKKGRS